MAGVQASRKNEGVGDHERDAGYVQTKKALVAH